MRRAAYAGDAFQLWTEAGVEAPVAPRTRVGVRTELRFTDDTQRRGLYNWNVGVAYLWSRQLVVALEFLQEYTRGAASSTENRPNATVTWVGQWRDVMLSDRNKFEGRLFEDGDDRFRYRNRVQAILPLELWVASPRPFLSEEIFVESAGRGFDQNRVAAGFVLVLDSLTATTCHTLLSVRDGGWTRAHVLGFAVTSAFGGGEVMPGDGGVMMIPESR